MYRLKLVLVLFVGILCSCTSETDELSIDKNRPVLNNSENFTPQILAKRLAVSLKENEILRDFIRNEVSMQNDGDFEFLIVESMDKPVVSSEKTKSVGGKIKTFGEYLLNNDILSTRSFEISNISDILNDIRINNPLLQVAVPNIENANWESIVSGGEPFFVAFLPNDYNEGDDVMAYDQNGNEHMLDGKVEPKTPVIVISENERLIAVPINEREKYANYELYYETSDYLYFLNSALNNNGLSLKSTSNDWYVLQAKFANQDALREFEPWTKGRPEILVQWYGEGIGRNYHEFGNKGWYNGKTVALNYKMFDFSYDGSDNKLSFDWWELDAAFITTHNDYIGHNYIENSLQPGTYKYSPISTEKGTNLFFWWLRLQYS